MDVTGWCVERSVLKPGSGITVDVLDAAGPKANAAHVITSVSPPNDLSDTGPTRSPWHVADAD